MFNVDINGGDYFGSMEQDGWNGCDSNFERNPLFYHQLLLNVEVRAETQKARLMYFNETMEEGGILMWVPKSITRVVKGEFYVHRKTFKIILDKHMAELRNETR